jgi:hypothetical protein
MRRSLQSIVLYEAKRCVEPQLHTLRPFQRKLAMMDQIYALVHSLDFLYPHQRQEILWRTATSKEPISPEIAWKRQQLITKELKKLSDQIHPFLSPERTHEESVDLLEQNLFVRAVHLCFFPFLKSLDFHLIQNCNNPSIIFSQ